MTGVFRFVLALGLVGLYDVLGPGCRSVQLKSETPAFGESIGQAGNALLAKGYLDVTLYDGCEGNAFDPTGRKDSTKANCRK